MSTAVRLPERVTISPDVLYQTVEGRAVLLDLRDERYYSLDDVGTRMWQLLLDHQEISIIADRMVELYDVEAEELRRDLAGFISKLAAAKLVELPPDFLGA